MGKPTLDELDERNAYLTAENEVVGRESELAEKKAIISELKKKYGGGWRKILGVGGHLDLATLRSFLGSAKSSLSGIGDTTFNPNLDPRPSGRQRRC